MIPVSALVLGTAKAGMPQYGYGSTSRPTAQESIAIIRRAHRAGIRRFDCALGYGDAWALLDVAGVAAWRTVMKCRLPIRPRLDLHPGPWLIHNPSVDELRDVPANCGVSVYTVAEVAAARARGIAPIQAPASCLNPPVDVEYARAPFLQGCLLRTPARAPEPLRLAVELFQALAADASLSPVALALHAAHRMSGGALVLGVSSERQLDEVLDAALLDPPAEVIAQARALAFTVDATAALPSLWSR